jgi:putative DNA methylase
LFAWLLTCTASISSAGYRHYHDLFNPHQLLHLSVLAEAIASTEGRERDALALAFSDHLTTNCMQTH